MQGKEKKQIVSFVRTNLLKREGKKNPSVSLWFDGCGSPVVPGILHIYFAALLQHLCCFVCVRKQSRGLRKPWCHQGVMVWQPPTPQNTLLQHFTLTHTHTLGRFSHHKPQPFKGRRTSNKMNYRDRNICLAHGNFRPLQQLLLASGTQHTAAYNNTKLQLHKGSDQQHHLKSEQRWITWKLREKKTSASKNNHERGMWWSYLSGRSTLRDVTGVNSVSPTQAGLRWNVHMPITSESLDTELIPKLMLLYRWLFLRLKHVCTHSGECNCI